ncbi:hypothetical protein DE146DRAFT_648136 [Phaeosphaeria sp. MPI-PUGE-AT-0046c]|nr:hypothetical protein DE146DRAFT_648136 [Phaeosphaeria sp. MPI-PUGE-AT-0046c]
MRPPQKLSFVHHPNADDASMQLSRLRSFLSLLCLVLLPIALLSTTWLFLYPVLHGCHFPAPHAPFRLLALGDPQLEGDSSLPDPNAPIFPSLEYFVQDLETRRGFNAKIDVLKDGAEGVVRDGGRWLEGKRKAIDLWGNDRYLAHIVRQTRWWTGPTHVAVLGDLLGSQWITDGEFEKRAGRYWDVVMKGLEKVPESVYGKEDEEEEKKAVAVEDGEQKDVLEAHNVVNKGQVDVVYDAKEVVDKLGEARQEKQTGDLRDQDGREETEASTTETPQQEDHQEDDKQSAESTADERKRDDPSPSSDEQDEKPKLLRKPLWGGTTEILGEDKRWANRVINIAGNHDVGYAGDLDDSRIARFEKAFGSVNWDIWFTLPSEPNTTETSPALRLVVLNTMNIDTPAWAYELQTETYSFMNHIITSSHDVSDKTHATVLLTHIPLEKQPGICVDSPLFNYFDDGQGIREQNMLSEYSSKTILQGVFGLSDYQFGAGQGLGRRGIILNGHDHEGCDVTHFIRQDGVNDACDVDTVKKEDAHWPTPTPTPPPIAPSTPAPESFELNPVNPLAKELMCAASVAQESPPPEPVKIGWRAHRFPHRPYSILHDPIANTTSCTRIDSSPHIREITLRSMMGDFSGHAGFLSAYFDYDQGDNGEWVFEFASCGVGVQHWWWAVYSIDFALVVIGVLSGLTWAVEKVMGRGGSVEKQMNGTTEKRYAKTNGR